jgi:tetratricopeptide (TPR) repeat protein
MFSDAKAYFSRSIALFQQALDAGVRNNQMLLEFAQALQNYGDLEARSGDGSAPITYNKAIELFKRVLADDPSSEGGQFGLDSVRRSIRLFGLTDMEDSILAQKKAEIDRALDKNFSMGIGKFHFGMTPDEVSRLLRVPFSLMSTSKLPYDISGGNIFQGRNYFWRPFT